MVLNFCKLNFFFKFKIENCTKIKKRLVIFTQGIFTPILKKIRTYCLCHPKEASCKKRKKVIEQFLRKLTLKFVTFDPMLIFRPPKTPVRVTESH